MLPAADGGDVLNFFSEFLNASQPGRVPALALLHPLDGSRRVVGQGGARGHRVPGSILVGRDGDSTIDVEPVPCPDPAETGSCPIRRGDFIPDVAVDPANGNLYAVWMDSALRRRHLPADHDNIAFSMSTDGGRTWSPTIKVNQTPTNEPNYDQQAFTPSVDVASDGTVTVSYYDFRNNTASPAALLTPTTSPCTATPAAPPRRAGRATSGGSRRCRSTSGRRRTPAGTSLGDYMGLASAGSDFLAVFGQAFAQNDANQYVSRLAPAP